MKNVFLILVAIAIVFTLTATAQETKTTDKKASTAASVTGEVIDSQCYLSTGAQGEDHLQCAVDCAKGGIPLAILEEKTGAVYFVGNGIDQMKGANSLLIDHITHKVTVKGKIVEKGGAKMIIAKSVEMAK